MERTGRLNSANDAPLGGDEQLWFPHPAQAPIRRHPFLVGGWLLFACLLLAFSLTSAGDDGWRAWAGILAQLAIAGGSVVVQRWFMHDRGVRLTWFPPALVDKKSAKIYWPLIVVLVMSLLVGLWWLKDKPYWLVFSALFAGAVLLVAISEYRYKSQYQSPET